MDQPENWISASYLCGLPCGSMLNRSLMQECAQTMQPRTSRLASTPRRVHSHVALFSRWATKPSFLGRQRARTGFSRQWSHFSKLRLPEPRWPSGYGSSDVFFVWRRVRRRRWHPVSSRVVRLWVGGDQAESDCLEEGVREYYGGEERRLDQKIPGMS